MTDVMKRERVTSFCGLVFLLALPNAVSGCAPESSTIDPFADVDPCTVGPSDPTEQPSGRHRSINGTGNHTSYFWLGAADTPLRRLAFADYEDGMGSMVSANRPSAREVSEALCSDTKRVANELGASDMLWQWGQFVDHDIDLTETQEPSEPAPIAVPLGDPWFDPTGTGLEAMELFRSVYHHGTGYDIYPRQQMNHITHFIDASNVYGSDDVRAAALRTNDGTGTPTRERGRPPALQHPRSSECRRYGPRAISRR